MLYCPLASSPSFSCLYRRRFFRQLTSIDECFFSSCTAVREPNAYDAHSLALKQSASGVVNRALGFDAGSHWFDPSFSYRLRAICEVWCLGDFRVVRTRSIAGGRLLSENSRNWKVLRSLGEFLGKFSGGCAECPRVSCRRSMIHASGGC